VEWQKLLSNRRKGKKPVEHDQSRSAFEQDYDRIIFSHPFRRLQDKTQVHPLPEDDFVHTRLTHSLEVSSVGRSLGKKAGKVILDRRTLHGFSFHDFGNIVAAASLCHDIGNPPFGHSGEEAISEFYSRRKGRTFYEHVSDEQWEDLTRFEGNAQGFRLLNKERFQGLKLTAATLAAFTKYPRPSTIEQVDPNRRSHKKFGFFQAENDIFRFVAEATGLLKIDEFCWCRHPLAFLVEAADDICYHLIDLEDGCRLGLVSYNDTEELYAQILKEQFIPEKLLRLDGIEERIGTLRAMAIGKLIDQCVELFLENEDALLSGKYDQALTDNIAATPVLKEIIKVSIEKIYRSPNVLRTEIAGFEVLPGLLEAFSHAAFSIYIRKDGALSEKTLMRLIPPETRHELERCGNDRDVYAMLMVINDLVSGMTDTHAISVYRQIKGISLPGM
jgi:dGTPase